MAAATFNVDLFDIDDPDNTLTQVLLYLEHQTVQVINTFNHYLQLLRSLMLLEVNYVRRLKPSRLSYHK